QQLAALGNQCCDLLAGFTYCAKTFDHAFAISFGAVLTHLPLALDAPNRNLDTDNGAHLHRDKIRRRIVDLPRRFPRPLSARGEVFELTSQPGIVVHDAGASPDMDGGVIPGWHHLAGLALGRIPGRRHIVLRPLEDDEAFLDSRKLLPLRV